MHLEELQKLVSKGESENLEFKKTTGQRSEAIKILRALPYFFANKEVPQEKKRPKIRPKIRPMLRPKIRPESHRKEVLNLLGDSLVSRSEIAKKIEHKHISWGIERGSVTLFEGYDTSKNPIVRLQQ